MEGRSWEQTILPRGRTNTHTQMSSVMQPAHGIPVLFMTVCHICGPRPFVCANVCASLKPSWSLGISVQANIQTLVSHVGNQQPAGQSKGNPLVNRERCKTLDESFYFYYQSKNVYF